MCRCSFANTAAAGMRSPLWHRECLMPGVIAIHIPPSGATTTVLHQNSTQSCYKYPSPGQGPTGFWAWPRIQGQLWFQDHVDLKTRLQDGGNWTLDIYSQNDHFGLFMTLYINFLVWVTYVQSNTYTDTEIYFNKYEYKFFIEIQIEICRIKHKYTESNTNVLNQVVWGWYGKSNTCSGSGTNNFSLPAHTMESCHRPPGCPSHPTDILSFQLAIQRLPAHTMESCHRPPGCPSHPTDILSFQLAIQRLPAHTMESNHRPPGCPSHPTDILSFQLAIQRLPAHTMESSHRPPGCPSHPTDILSFQLAIQRLPAHTMESTHRPPGCPSHPTDILSFQLAIQRLPAGTMESGHRRHSYTTDRGSAQKPRSKKSSKKFWDPAAKAWRLQSLGNFLKSKQYPVRTQVVRDRTLGSGVGWGAVHDIHTCPPAKCW